MLIYLSLAIVILILHILNSRKMKVNYIVFSIVSILLILIYSLRYYVGSDFFLYYLNFNSQNFESRDWLFEFISKLNYFIFDGNWYLHSIILGIITYIPVLLFYRNNSSKFLISILIYIFSYNYFFPFNGIRQGLALSLYILAYNSLIKREKIKFSLYIIGAFLFHSTVLIAIPFMFLSLVRYNSKILKSINLLLVVSVLFIGKLWPLILEVFALIGQEKIANDYSNVVIGDGDMGSSYLRLLVYVVPVILGIYYYRIKKNKNNITKVENVILNTQTFACILMFASTKYWIFSRVALYFSIFTPVVYVKYIECFEKKSQNIYVIILLTVYLIYMLLLLLNGEGSMLPYQNVFGWTFK